VEFLLISGCEPGYSGDLTVNWRVVIFDRMNAVTRILNASEQGEAQAANELLPLVYDELQRLAAQRLAQEAPGQTLQATALVHEAYLRLVGSAEGPASSTGTAAVTSSRLRPKPCARKSFV
jgi:hypothetical protein